MPLYLLDYNDKQLIPEKGTGLYEAIISHFVSQDPAIQQVTTNTSNVQRGLEDYNPFADQGDQRPTAVRYQSDYLRSYKII